MIVVRQAGRMFAGLGRRVCSGTYLRMYGVGGLDWFIACLHGTLPSRLDVIAHDICIGTDMHAPSSVLVGPVRSVVYRVGDLREPDQQVYPTDDEDRWHASIRHINMPPPFRYV